MKAAVVKEFKKSLVVQEIEKPQIGYGEVLVKMKACGVCHTDLHAAHGDWPVKPKLPLVPGHEGVGIVTEVGEGITHVKIGDRVGVPWLYSACGQCEYCLSGKETLCESQQNSGYSVDGGYAEYCKADANYIVKIPDQLTYEEAAPIFCAGVTTYKALKVSGVKPGEWVAIYGVGGLGHVAVQYAKAMGMNVVAVDLGEVKLQLAKELGADLIVNPNEEDPDQFIKSHIQGVHGAVVTAVSKPAFQAAFQSVRRGGTCVLVGLPPEEMPIPIFDTVLGGISIIGSIVGTRKDLQEALEFAATGKVKTIIEVQPLEKINEVFDRMINGDINGRIVLSLED
ncbi:alcohol dehydrogenase AdhP [Metabacillus litoralis]|uniref:alcohol dehydrogenase AdhP n=1 Tax=Metabacillus litoralis TaxID=152268 RepID=UPI001CFCE7DF|nr:alcohol dehydrogenase AdhP [Metabacillus litoralis]